MDAENSRSGSDPIRRQGAGRPFLPGVSGNPGGRPSGTKEVSALAREHTAEALQTLLRLMKSSPRDEVRARCAETLLDRGWGRAPVSVAVEIGTRVSLTGVSPEEWAALAALRHLVRPALPATVEVEALPHGASASTSDDGQLQATEEPK